jgi:DNA-binding CsgD family transcriptional regulator
MAVREVDGVHGLTRREVEVLGHLAAGLTNEQIARCLGVSNRMARAHVAHIMDKLNAATRTAAVAAASREGLIPLAPQELD